MFTASCFFEGQGDFKIIIVVKLVTIEHVSSRFEVGVLNDGVRKIGW